MLRCFFNSGQIYVKNTSTLPLHVQWRSCFFTLEIFHCVDLFVLFSLCQTATAAASWGRLLDGWHESRCSSENSGPAKHSDSKPAFCARKQRQFGKIFCVLFVYMCAQCHSCLNVWRWPLMSDSILGLFNVRCKHYFRTSTRNRTRNLSNAPAVVRTSAKRCLPPTRQSKLTSFTKATSRCCLCASTWPRPLPGDWMFLSTASRLISNDVFFGHWPNIFWHDRNV